MNSSALNLAEDLIQFISGSPTAFHCVIEVESRLQKKGFIRLDEVNKWNLEKGGRYYVVRNGSSLVAFVPGEKKVWEAGFKIAGAHTDSPSLKIKNEGASVVGGLLRVSVEPYGGGGINSTWLDRNLSIAGRIVVENEKGSLESKYIDLKDPLALIPNQAIHMNRDMNKGIEYNKQNHLQAVLTQVDNDSEDSPAVLFKKLIADKSALDVNKIVDMELFLYDIQRGIIGGMNKEFLTSARIDNLAMCHCLTDSILEAGDCGATSVAAFFDNEEIGSTTIQGADSSFLRDLLDRITIASGGSIEETFQSRARSFSISADGAHAHHPNYGESHDPAYTPVINGGPVIKISSNYKYSTTSETSPVFKKLCKDCSVPYQELINRSDVPSGSTIGVISSALTGIRSVDVGSPMFAMHSIRETCGVLDHFYMSEVLKRFFKYDLNSH